MHIIQQRGRLHDHQNGAAAVLCLWVVVNLLGESCDACSSRRSHSPAPSPPPTVVRTSPTSSRSSSGGTTISTTESPSDISPSGNLSCFSTTITNLTNETIAKKLDQFARTGNLSSLFLDSTTEKSVFLKWFKPNDTGCSNVQGYLIKVIKIRHGSPDPYKYKITQLENASAFCDEYKNCRTLTFSAESKPSKPTTATSKVTEKTNHMDATSKQTIGSRPTGNTANKETNTGEGDGTAAAGKAGDAAVSTTTIVIPVTLVVLLVVVVGIFALWFKRRSARKNDKEITKTQNSVDRLAGPVNGDVYTVPNPSRKNDSKDLVYTELAEINPGKRDVKQPESDQTEYADITHILTDNTTGCKKGAPQTDENEAYANVVALKNGC